ncbi:hypothetical protein M9458_018135, partial [Cirrhinus mrigala]
ENVAWDPDEVPDNFVEVEEEGVGDEEEQDHTISPLFLRSTKDAIHLSLNASTCHLSPKK